MISVLHCKTRGSELKPNCSAVICIISASLTINIIERKRSWNRPVAYSVCLVLRSRECTGRTTDWIRMPFGVVSGVSREIDVLDGVHVPRVEGEVLGVFRLIG